MQVFIFTNILNGFNDLFSQGFDTELGLCCSNNSYTTILNANIYKVTKLQMTLLNLFPLIFDTCRRQRV